MKLITCSRYFVLPLLLVTGLLSCSCTNEFEWTEPPKWQPKPEPDPQSYDVRMETLLDEMISFDEAAKFPSVAYTCRQESSHDRRSVTPGTPEWFANDDGWGFIRDEVNQGRSERVLFDEKGPGVITRIWLTSFQAPTTIIRFYFDGAERPSWELSSFDLQEICASMGPEWKSSYLRGGLAHPVPNGTAAARSTCPSLTARAARSPSRNRIRRSTTPRVITRSTTAATILR